MYPYLLYQDDFEVDNPLGSKAGADKISGVYLSFALLPDSKISKLENIRTCCYTKSSDISHGNNSNFMPLINVLKDLEEFGVNVPSRDGNIQVHLLLAAVTGDNLGLNSILGFVKSFSANHFCRKCNCSKSVMQIQVKEDHTKLRNNENYSEAVDKNDVFETGVKENCVFNIIKSFNIIDNVTCDIMHDIFEGIAHYELCDILNYLIFKQKYFSLSLFNARKRSFDYGPEDNKNKTVDVKIQHIMKKKLKMSASEMKCFLHFLPLIIGDLVPTDNNVWIFLQLLLKLVETALLPSFTETILIEFRSLIAEHHQTYLNIFGGNLKPKHHFILHYITTIKKLGPIKKLWSMRFEAKHKENKNYANTITSRKNILLSLAIKSNYQFAYNISLKTIFEKPLDTACDEGTLINFTTYDAWTHIPCCKKNLCNFTHIFSLNVVLLNCTRYKIGTILATRNDHKDVSVFEIRYIFLENEENIFLVCIKLDILEIDSHIDCFVISQNNDNISYDIIEVCDVTSPPLHLIHLPNEKVVVKLKTPFY